MTEPAEGADVLLAVGDVFRSASSSCAVWAKAESESGRATRALHGTASWSKKPTARRLRRCVLEGQLRSYLKDLVRKDLICA